MPHPEEITKWLNICATDHYGEECRRCPYYKDKAGCGKLLSDAALLLSAAYGDGIDVKFTGDPAQPSQVLKKQFADNHSI